MAVTENLATGIAANAKGLPGAAAGTFLGGVTFLALGVAGLGALIAPIRVELPTRFAVWTIQSPGELGAGAVSPLEERNVVGVDTFSIWTWKVVFAVIFSPAAAAVAIPQAIMNRSEARSIEILSRYVWRGS